MPIPFIIGAAALATAAYGAKKAYDGHQNKKETEKLQECAESICENAERALNQLRNNVENCLEELGKVKIHLYSNSLKDFVDTFSKIKNVEMDRIVTDDLKVSNEDFIQELKENVITFTDLAGGGIASIGAGVLAGIGAYGGATALATALATTSTGTAITTLSGAAATNATLAWFGGGSLAAGGLGMTGGMAVLGGIVAAPVLAVGGFLYAKAGEAALDDARVNLKKAKAAGEEVDRAREVANEIVSVVSEALEALEKLGVIFSEKMPMFKEMVDRDNDFSKYSIWEKFFVQHMVILAKTIDRFCSLNVLIKQGKINQKFKRVIGRINRINRKNEKIWIKDS